MTTSDPLSQLIEIMELPFDVDEEGMELGGRIEYCSVEVPGAGKP